MRLTMKMKKRMEALEQNRTEITKKNATLLKERKQLLDLIKSTAPLPVSLLDEQDLDFSIVESAWKKWDEQRQNAFESLSLQLAAAEQASRSGMLSSRENTKTVSTEDSAGNADTPHIDTEKESLRTALIEAQTKVRKYEMDADRLRASEDCLKTQVMEQDKALANKNVQFEQLKREMEIARAQLEERVLLMQMQSNNSKSNFEARDRDVSQAQQQIKALSVSLEEKTLALNSHKEIVAALQTKLMEIEPELDRARAKVKEHHQQLGSHTVLKAEQEALLSSLRKDLKTSLDSREALTKQIKDTEDFKGRYDIATNKLSRLEAEMNDILIDKEEKVATIIRLRTEAQANERNHAMRTAMLATCEAQLETLQGEMVKKDDTAREAIERVAGLQTALSAAEARLAERVSEANKVIERLEGDLKLQTAEHAARLTAKATEHDAALEAAKREFNKKSATARSMLSEKEEEARVLSARVQELQAEIASGAPSERRIFELARVQSQREATHSMHSDTRELAFHQLQTTLSSKDLQLAQAQSSQSALTAEIAELRRTVRREGVNMDYLKNIVHQVLPCPHFALIYSSFTLIAYNFLFSFLCLVYDFPYSGARARLPHTGNRHAAAIHRTRAGGS